MSFVHLHNHSEFSLLDGLNRIKNLVGTAKRYNMPAIALTDHGVMYGAIEFYKACKEASIKPIIGCELYVAGRNHKQKETKEDSINNHIILLAKNEEGYKSLSRLLTIAHIDGFYYKPRIDMDLLSENSKGLIVLSACLKGQIPNLLLEGRTDQAKEVAYKLKNIFGNDFYIELQNHNLKEEIRVIPLLVNLAKELDLPIVATQDAHYPEKSDAYYHDILLCVQTLSSIDDPKRLKFETDEFYLKSPEEMKLLFHELPEALTNTLEIAAKCNIDFDFEKMHLPTFSRDDLKTLEDKFNFIKSLCENNLPKKYGDNISHEITDRLNFELEMIKKMNFIDYLLVVWDFIKHAKDKNIFVGPGRGSAAGSIVSYLLDITGIDPLKYKLYFERFLNPERINMPDIDIDFADERRDEVIAYVREKYGKNRVAQVATFGKMESRAVIRDVARALKYSYNDADKIAKKIPQGLSLEETYNSNPDFKEIIDISENNKKLYEISLKLEGLTRNFSVHAAGIVIGDEELWNYLPLQLDKNKNVVTQFDKDVIEKIGLLKIDFLGLRTLTVLDSSAKLIKKNHSIDIDFNTLLLDDKETYKLYQSAETKGVFQVESRGMRKIFKDLVPTNIEDIIAVIALFRPGPMNLIETFINNKFNPDEITYIHKDLEQILKSTYGICLYQEQVMEIARKMAGFSLGQADILRKAMGKKKPELMFDLREKFILNSIERGYTKEIASDIFSTLEYFAGYGFNRAHAVSYGFISYWTAYLKVHYPLEFFTAVLNSCIGNEIKIGEYCEECKRNNIEIIPPELNKSDGLFKIEDKGIRYGLLAIKNVGNAAIDFIINEREKKGNYKSLPDLTNRAGSKANKKIVEFLIKAGALDSFNKDRKFLLSQAENNEPQYSLFDLPSDNTMDTKIDLNINMVFEKEALGFYLTNHPLEPYLEVFDDIESYSIADLQDLTDNDLKINLLGIIDSVRYPKNKMENNSFGFLTFEDITGSIELMASGNLLSEAVNLIGKEGIVQIEVRYRKEDERVRINLNKIIRFISKNDLIKEKNKQVNLNIRLDFEKHNNPDLTKLILGILSKYKGDNPVFLKILKDNREIKTVIGSSLWVAKDKNIIEELSNILGKENIWWQS